MEEVAATDGFYQDTTASDRGLGEWVSRWRVRTGALARPIRSRLEVSIVEDSSVEGGWIIRYACPIEKVEDLSRSFGYEEKDWERGGQNGRYEQVFRNRLQIRLGLNVTHEGDASDDPFLERSGRDG